MLDVIDVGFSPDVVPYLEAWDLQRRVHDEVVSGTRGDTLLLLEHEPVYTAGKRTNSWDRPMPGTTTTPVIDVDRGGKITWHGPGQLVGYPIVRLSDPVDVVAYVRRLESLLIDVCGALGVQTIRVEGRSGVWVPADARGPERKVAAIGVRVARGVTMHGFALNANNSLDPFHRIVPCGIADAGVTTLSAELGRDVSVREVHDLVVAQVWRAGAEPLGGHDPRESFTPDRAVKDFLRSSEGKSSLLPEEGRGVGAR